MKVTISVFDPVLNTETTSDREYPITEVVLMPDKVNPDRVTMLMCDSCGRALGQYTGFIFRKIPEGTPFDFLKEHPLVLLYCRLCKRRYLINNIL